MAILEILTQDNDTKNILRQVARKVNPDEIKSLQPLIDDMLETTIHIGAVGLAAPQVGHSIQLFVLEDGTVCINPGSTMGSGKITSHAEGCLSVPGKRFNIKRIRNVIVRCLDRHGKPQMLKPKKKLYSIAIQHEIDHLNGRLVCDKGELIEAM
jgi:peptide deformylase